MTPTPAEESSRQSWPRDVSFPTGTVTFLFTDVEHSTEILARLGDEGYTGALHAMRDILRAAFDDHHGHEVDTQGDAFFAVFQTAHEAVAAATQAQRALAAHAWPEGGVTRVRMGLHTGTPLLAGDHYVGFDVHRAARIGAAGHGGQILLSTATAELARGARDGLPEETALRDLGEYRLKDLREPERLWQLVLADLPNDFPLPRTLDRHKHNLPIQPTPLLGREREVADIGSLLREDAWLVTLTGPPGVGKTRLSLQVAAELTSATDLFPDGVWFTRLSRLTDPALVIATIAHGFGLRESGALPIAELLAGYLESRRALLVLDNFEHVAEAARDVAELRQRCPGVRVLATSRAPLRLRGEREYALSPLPVLASAGAGEHVTPERVLSVASGQLFSERAQAAVADFAVTPATAPALARICARLDGLPLALELAAARIKALPPDALLARLERALPLLTGGPRDADERQQTMRATLAWSDRLLSADERALFRRLAVFAGGATLEWIEAVCLNPDGASPLDLDALTGLAALMDQSLIQRREEGGEPRYVMLHVIREHALERLGASGEGDALRRAHALACLRLAEEVAPLDGLGNPAWLTRMGAEQDNLRAAMAWALERSDPELGMRLAIGMDGFISIRGDARECYAWLLRMLRLDEETPHPSSDASVDTKRAWARRYALYAVKGYAEMSGDDARAVALEDELLTLSRAAGDKAMEADIIYSRAQLAGIIWEHEKAQDTYWKDAQEPADGQKAEAEAMLRAAIAAIQDCGDDALRAGVLTWSGWDFMRLAGGEPERLAEALALTEEGIRLARDRGNLYFERQGAGIAAFLSMELGDMEHARAAICRTMEIITTYGYEDAMQSTLGGLMSMAAHEGRAVRAARLAGGQRTIEYARGWEVTSDNNGLNQPYMPDAHAALGAEAWARHYTEGAAMSRAEVIAEAWREARGEPE